MSCALLAVPFQTVTGEKVEILPLHPEVKWLLGDHSLLAGLAQKAVELPASQVQMATRTYAFYKSLTFHCNFTNFQSRANDI